MRRSFDWLARPYRWFEYATFGRWLERCRYHHLPRMRSVRNALVLGDGDGRFTARLLAAAPDARMLAVDNSPAMLALLRARCETAGFGERLLTCHADLAKGLPLPAFAQQYDLVATHFFLDCLSTGQVEQLAWEAAPLLLPGGCWILSEFHVPATLLRLPARVLVRVLYLLFRLFTGLKTQHLPDYPAAFTACGLRLRQRSLLLCGLLVSEVWIRPAAASTSGGQ